MKCSRVQLIIDETGDLDRLPVEAARHVASCSACERFGRELVELRALLREPGRVSAPADFDAGLARRLRAAREVPAQRPSWLRAFVPAHGLATAAALGLLVCGSVAVTRFTTAEREPAAPPEVATVKPPAPADVSRPGNRGVLEPTTPGGVADTGDRTARVVVKPHASKEHKLAEPARSSDAIILVRDEAGTRVYNVPTVLVGGERIVPALASAAQPESSDAGVSF